ncbi:hypothetical protein AVEN_66119-1 [Araneus ventricosus]|uniref:Uncharacterized protein n=1 Tax=Araneus ventricosus TaxID=182803 RepID=A0A4Y2HHQ6_ARAVE|nr:hypothetical protein AVEN_66119-1 [Araneus ventricosus]
MSNGESQSFSSDPLNFSFSFGRVPVDSSLLEEQDVRFKLQRDKRTPGQEQRGLVTVTSITVRYAIACKGVFPLGKTRNILGRILHGGVEMKISDLSYMSRDA